MQTISTQYKNAFEFAIEMMNDGAELEPTSALKEAGRQYGIAYGDEMQAFIDWAMQTVANN